MTTEIAVINRLGVALAADSAVTISGFGTEKVFDTGDKLFELSHKHAVAIMVNGNLDFLGVPWELIIKDFRASDPNPVPSSIREWSDAFLSFTVRHRAVKDVHSARWLAEFIEEEVTDLQFAAVEQYRSLLRVGNEDTTPEDTLVEQIEKREKSLNDAKPIDSLLGIPVEQINNLEASITKKLSDAFPDQTIGAEQRPRIAKLLVNIIKCEIEQDTRTGLVICGFGGDDLFPSLYATVVDGVLFDHLRFRPTHNVEITREIDDCEGTTRELGTAISFAQTDVIERLLRGVDERFVEKTKSFLDQAVGNSLKSVFEELNWKITGSDDVEIDVDDLARFLGDTLPSLYEDTAVSGIGDEIEREFKQTISLMPKQELIELAEALVSITAVERKATRDAGTVGGPIDVALITRSEGFVWIKRKHHFRAELNPRYISRVHKVATVGDAA